MNRRIGRGWREPAGSPSASSLPLLIHRRINRLRNNVGDGHQDKTGIERVIVAELPKGSIFKMSEKECVNVVSLQVLHQHSVLLGLQKSLLIFTCYKQD